MFIKQSAGLTFMIGVLLLGLAGLAGGQLWVYTGSSVLAVGAGILCLSVLLAATGPCCADS